MRFSNDAGIFVAGNARAIGGTEDGATSPPEKINATHVR